MTAAHRGLDRGRAKEAQHVIQDARLEARSAETVRRYAHLDSETEYVRLLRRVDELAADGHRDEESW